MAKPVKAVIQLQLLGGQASPAPPVGPALSQHKVNMMQFIKEYNDRTAQNKGEIVPVEITVYNDSSFSLRLKNPPTSVLIKKALSLEKASSSPGLEVVAEITRDQLKQIAKTKMDDLNAIDIDGAVNIVAGSARSMGIAIEGEKNAEAQPQV